MPIFEFRCLDCGTLFEKLFMNSDEEIQLICPKCQSKSLERVVSRTNHAIGLSSASNHPKITSKSCGPSNECMTLDLPGPTR
ncbi:MAG: zinc ribbon domain-containing protein [Deltaproteobacteria bacterium]|nr:zinc ribbon domain-containing protein [Deltaproteobacteria bacterium]